MRKLRKPKSNINMHWSAYATLKYGTLISLIILIAGFFFPKASYYAINLCRCAVYSFATSVIGGLMLDVCALKRNMHR